MKGKGVDDKEKIGKDNCATHVFLSNESFDGEKVQTSKWNNLKLNAWRFGSLGRWPSPSSLPVTLKIVSVMSTRFSHKRIVFFWIFCILYILQTSYFRLQLKKTCFRLQIAAKIISSMSNDSKIVHSPINRRHYHKTASHEYTCLPQRQCRSLCLTFNE